MAPMHLIATARVKGALAERDILLRQDEGIGYSKVRRALHSDVYSVICCFGNMKEYISFEKAEGWVAPAALLYVIHRGQCRTAVLFDPFQPPSLPLKHTFSTIFLMPMFQTHQCPWKESLLCSFI